jgi:hypothetical protein
MDKLLGFIQLIFSLAPVQAAVVGLFLFGLSKLFIKYKWLHAIAEIAIESYEYAEKQGLIQGLKGYEKFDPFMDKFIEQYRAKYGKEPSPADKGQAVAVMEKQVQLEKK